MSIAAEIFRPGPGTTHARYTQAWAEAATYPGDWVSISHAAPTGQGSGGDGVLGEGTLIEGDYVYVALTDTDVLGSEALCIGAAVGSGVHAVNDWSDVSGDVVAADNLVLIQTWGVHPQVRIDDGDAGVKGHELYPSDEAGEATAAIATYAEDQIHLTILGACLGVDAAYTRAAAESGMSAWIRCLG